ncbi:MAG TPA: hypothetical protein VGL55_13865 [Steroidobacteraceae bacterium]
MSDWLREEVRREGIRVTAIYPPDFAPRVCAYSAIVLDNMAQAQAGMRNLAGP